MRMLPSLIAFHTQPASQAYLGLFLIAGAVLVVAFVVAALIRYRRK
jgi:hypothetical protein